ncbi:uncharacterized protein LOC124403113 isoform X3 [Silurus meridionalis]|uniref:uncharacterized protein LOC124403113 isoform X3 n=1 Tax=Silurus meridionalis TaxID=175797 RepID=UPI001EEC07BD|nr:uncharacterized protein LOC124403113 isoform X3 [Silurus meridionalis]
MEMKEIEIFVVIGADHAVFAHEGEDVILNCSVDSHVPASEIEEVTWKKKDGDESILVLLYQNSEIFPDSSHESYQGRVDFFSSEISKGNFSLQLKEVKMEDKGEFTCEVHTSDMSARTTVILHGVEHFVVKGADHAVFANEGEDVILNCSVDSHVPMSEIEEVTWKKTDGDQDILVLLYQDSEIFLDSSHESYRGRVDFFLSEITKGNFSLKLKEVKMKDRGEFTCEVHTSDLSARTTVLLHGVDSFCTATAAFLFTAYGTMCIYYTYILLRSQDRGGFLALMPLLHVLAATCLFKHPKHLPDLLHIMVYMFGAVGLSTINSIVLATELILKEGKGVRNIEDLCTIVLPLETLFVSAWLILQIYDAWLRFKDGSHQFEDETTGFEVAEMEVLTNPDPNSKSE